MSHQSPNPPLPDPREMLAELRARLRNSRRWRERMRGLLDALEVVEEDDTLTECESHAPALEAYAGDLARGVDTAGWHPALVAHLRTCALCREDLIILSEAFAATPGSIARAAPAGGASPFAQPAGEPVQVLPRAQLLRPGRGLLVRFDPAFLVSRFQQESPLALRGAGDEAAPLVLLAEPRAVEAQDWHLQAQVTPAATPDQVTLCAELLCEPQPPLRVTLQWGKLTETRACDTEGRVCFEHLPADVLRTAQPRVALDIEVVNE